MTTDPSDIVERLKTLIALHPFAAVVHTNGDGSQIIISEYGEYAVTDAIAEITRLRAALAAAKTKLKLYRAQHSGEYIGGMEYGMLLDMINEVLGESKYDR